MFKPIIMDIFHSCFSVKRKHRTSCQHQSGGKNRPPQRSHIPSKSPAYQMYLSSPDN